jgi:hypothetical protein
MTINIDSFFVYILLILTGIVLFLCILNLLTLRELSGRIRKARDASPWPKREAEDSSHPAILENITTSEGDGRGSGPVKRGDIMSAIDMVAGKYHLDSLVIASRDGLLIASAGSSDPESEAAYSADLISRKTVVPDHGIHLFEFGYSGMGLIGIVRGKNLPYGEKEEQMEKDIRAVFDSQLGRNAGIFGEAI